MSSWYQHDPMTALAAKEAAQRLAFAPIAFHAALSLRDLGILSALDAAGSAGLTIKQTAERTSLSDYGVGVLLDMGLSARIVTEIDGRYALARVGHFLLHDAMTRANMNFTADVCYRGMAQLSESVRGGEPAGLREFGNWPTIYEGLSQLPQDVRSSWFGFDHYYSDNAFGELLPRVFAGQPRRLVDIGANTGRWALRCCAFDPTVELTLVDLPQQLAVAMANLHAAGFGARVKAHPLDLLDASQALPDDGDVWWMSQFLDCFSPLQVVDILSRVRAAMPASARLYILESFPDRQRFESAAYSLNAASLYFTCLANGNSRFYRCDDFLALVRSAGLELVEQVDGIGLGHSLLQLRRGDQLGA